MARLSLRAIRPPDPEIPNGNDPATAAPGTVGPPDVNPGDPDGVVFVPPGPAGPGLPTIRPSAWSGWPADWETPFWNSDPHLANLVDMAWLCLDMNSRLLGTMPPYLVGAASSLNADWLTNPDPELTTSWEEFARQLFWDYYAAGEAFVLATARYATGWPARFHVVPPWTVNVEMDGGRRFYSIGDVDVTGDILHLRYLSNVTDARGHGPLEAGRARMVAAQVLLQYVTSLVSGGGIPSGILNHPEKQDQAQSNLLKAQWVEARMSSIGAPAVLSGGVTWEPTQIDPEKMALTELQTTTEARIAYLLGVPSALVGLGSGGDSMTYSNVMMYFLQHWRVGLRPSAQFSMSGLSGWLLPRGTRIELNRDAYIEPEPLVRAQTAEIMNRIRDADGKPAMTVQEIRDAERLDDSTPQPPSAGVLR